MKTSSNNNNIESKNRINNSREQIKIGDKVRHNLTGDRMATVTGIRRVQGYKWEGEITVYRLDFGESVKGPFGMEMNGGEYQREAFTFFDEQSGKAERQEASEIKPKAAFQIGDRVERIGTGAAGTIDDVNNYEEQLTYIVKYDETQRRPSDGFEYLTEEVFENEIEPAPVLYGSRPVADNNSYIVSDENTLGYIIGTQKPGHPVSFVVMAVNVEAGGDSTLIDRETIATNYRPATNEDQDTFKVRLF